jgi:hypothetical protein
MKKPTVPNRAMGEKDKRNEFVLSVHRAGCAAGGREESDPRQRIHMHMHMHIEVRAARLRGLVE